MCRSSVGIPANSGGWIAGVLIDKLTVAWAWERHGAPVDREALPIPREYRAGASGGGKAISVLIEGARCDSVDQHQTGSRVGHRAVLDQDDPLLVPAAAELPRRLEQLEELA